MRDIPQLAARDSPAVVGKATRKSIKRSRFGSESSPLTFFLFRYLLRFNAFLRPPFVSGYAVSVGNCPPPFLDRRRSTLGGAEDATDRPRPGCRRREIYVVTSETPVDRVQMPPFARSRDAEAAERPRGPCEHPT